LSFAVRVRFVQRRAGRISQMRKEAVKRGLDPDKWFNNVELVTAEKVGIETTTYVRDIYNYYVAYRLMLDIDEAQKKARGQIACVSRLRSSFRL
jgi:membrane-bound lytic murein transglycosylase MltF